MRLYASNANQSRSTARYARLHRPMSAVTDTPLRDGTPGLPVERASTSVEADSSADGSWLRALLRSTGVRSHA